MYNDSINTTQLSNLASIGNVDNSDVQTDSIASLIVASILYCTPAVVSTSAAVVSAVSTVVSAVSTVAGCGN